MSDVKKKRGKIKVRKKLPLPYYKKLIRLIRQRWQLSIVVSVVLASLVYFVAYDVWSRYNEKNKKPKIYLEEKEKYQEFLKDKGVK